MRAHWREIWGRFKLDRRGFSTTRGWSLTIDQCTEWCRHLQRRTMKRFGSPFHVDHCRRQGNSLVLRAAREAGYAGKLFCTDKTLRWHKYEFSKVIRYISKIYCYRSGNQPITLVRYFGDSSCSDELNWHVSILMLKIFEIFETTLFGSETSNEEVAFILRPKQKIWTAVRMIRILMN